MRTKSSIFIISILIGVFWLGVAQADPPSPPIPPTPSYSYESPPGPSGVPTQDGFEVYPQILDPAEGSILRGFFDFLGITRRAVPLEALPGSFSMQTGGTLLINVQDTASTVPNPSINPNDPSCVDLDISFANPPQHGIALVADSSGNPSPAGLYISYTPTPGFIGIEQIGYKIKRKPDCTLYFYGDIENIITVMVQGP